MELDINYLNEYPVSSYFKDTYLLKKFAQTPIRIGSQKEGVIFPRKLTYDFIKSFEIKGTDVIITSVSDNFRIPQIDLIVQPAILLNIIKERQLNFINLYKNFPIKSDLPGVYILLSGLPGSGKSSTAQYLSNCSDFIHIDFAKIAFYLYNSWIHYEENFSMLGNIVSETINKLLSKGYSVIHDTTSINHEMIEYHISGIKKAKKKVLITFDIDSEICRERINVERPFRSPDSREEVKRLNNRFVKTFNDYVDLREENIFVLDKVDIIRKTMNLSNANLLESLKKII